MGGYGRSRSGGRVPERVLYCSPAASNADSAERRAGRAATIELIEEDGAVGLWENQRDKLFGEQARATRSSSGNRWLSRDQDELRRAEAIRDRPDSTDVLRSLPVVFALGESDVYFPVDEVSRVRGRVAQESPCRLRPLQALAESRAAGLSSTRC